ncbi:hypothetical protein EXIGLDRAFT_723488 [Exidia glandulosa HHB12029]|uniref:Fungal-type protein kinase domain-containing protein n=1 Tax=Exidia glandulosa HHB12029 TaxID=1314781 RepID=A0A165ETF7_EXIGL|nr:hypothetical protein EXIGLDRAFT_723488 [Exidia glandulosa HHB12029]
MAESHTSPSPQLLAHHDTSKDHHVDPKDAPASNVSPYVADILDSSVCDNTWTAIEGDVALASRLQSNDKQPHATFLLNALSLLASTIDDQAVLFDSAAHHIARDWVAVQVPLHELRQAVRDTMAMVEAGSELAGWPRILAVGLVEKVRARRERDCDSDDSDCDSDEEDQEDDGKEDEEDKLRTILTALKAYRPDLLSVHGCELYASGRLRLAHVDAHAFVASVRNDCAEESELSMREQLSPWLAHIFSIQRALATRDKTINARLPSLEDDFVRYDVTLGLRTVCVTPAAASRPPGRMTWVGFEVGGDANVHSSVRSEDSLGVVKLSYQPQLKDGRPTEGEVLDLVHADGWLPGVVRHTSWERNKARIVVATADSPSLGLAREKEIVHMASVGDPLSQCRTPLQMLKVAYDATETHLQLLNRGIIHRDFSWFNILCNPRHEPRTLATKTAVTGIPCIDYVLTDDASKEPRCLIVDFDYAERYPQELKEAVGTPAFIACELSISKPSERPVNPRLRHLLPRFRALEDLPVFRRAFPDDDGTFVETFAAIVALEEERDELLAFEDYKNPLDPALKDTDPKDVVHDPCYDIQSIYWVLLWFFALAQPATASSENDVNLTEGSAFADFVSTMLEHRIGYEYDRKHYLTRGLSLTVHPAFRHLEFGLLRSLAAYLAVPWHMYKGDHPRLKVPLKPEHAHIAMRRLLLAEIYKLTTDETERHASNWPLDPSRPRDISARNKYYRREGYGYWSPTPMQWHGAECEAVDADAAILKRQLLDNATHGHGTKRNADDAEIEDNAASSKRQKHEQGTSCGDDEYSQEPVALEQAATSSRSAAARCAKLKDDRWLFFNRWSPIPIPLPE